MSDLTQNYIDKLHWLEMGIPYSDSPHKNPNESVFYLAMLWEDVEPLIRRLDMVLADSERVAELEKQADEVRDVAAGLLAGEWSGSQFEVGKKLVRIVKLKTDPDFDYLRDYENSIDPDDDGP